VRGHVAAYNVLLLIVPALEVDADNGDEDEADKDDDEHYDPAPVIGEPGGIELVGLYAEMG